MTSDKTRFVQYCKCTYCSINWICPGLFERHHFCKMYKGQNMFVGNLQNISITKKYFEKLWHNSWTLWPSLQPSSCPLSLGFRNHDKKSAYIIWALNLGNFLKIYDCLVLGRSDQIRSFKKEVKISSPGKKHRVHKNF